MKILRLLPFLLAACAPAPPPPAAAPQPASNMAPPAPSPPAKPVLRAVFHLSDPSRAIVLRGLTNAKNAVRALGSEDARFVLVVHGKAVGWLRREEPENLTREAGELMATGKVAIRVCAKTMEENDWKLGDMVQGVTAVPSGTLEVLRLEADGHHYFKP